MCMLVMAAVVCLWTSAQTIEHVINMDKLVANKGLYLSQNNPNPFNGSTEVYLAVVDRAPVTLVMTDINGRMEAQYTSSMASGVHRFVVSSKEKGMHVMSVHQYGRTSACVMFCNERAANSRIDYMEMVEAIDEIQFRELIASDKEEDFIGYSLVKSAQPSSSSEPFRVALSLSPFSLNQFDQGYTFVVGDQTATTPAELQSIYKSLGSTEMYMRVATKRHKTYNTDGSLDNTVDGKQDENANAHTFDQAIELAKIAASLNIPLNPEIMCAYTYMDMDKVQAPRFEEYPSIYALQNGKKWEELSLDEICTVLEAYGEFVADSILATGCKVVNWNLGNEANYGFAGVGMGVKTAVDSKLEKCSAIDRYTAAIFKLWWLKKHVWKYNAKQFAAVKRGILKAYAKAGKDASDVKFCTHIATVTFTVRASASYFQYMAKNGYKVETAGISYYPSAPAMSFNKKKLLTNTITRINKKCDVPVFIGEFSYPSQDMVGPFAGWNSQLGSYQKNQQGQEKIYADVIAWGKTHGMAGIRYWAPDYEGEWYPMSMFEFKNKVGTAKSILINHKNIVEQ